MIVYNSEKSEVYPIGESLPIDLIEVVKLILSFDNWKILQIVFPNLFINLYQNIKKEENNKKEINAYLLKLFNEINYEKLNEYFYIKEKYKYRRLSSCQFFDNYFRNNLKIDNIKNETIQILNNCIQNTSEFNNKLYSLFNENSNLVIDYVNFWNSNFNKNIYDSATKNLIKNIMLLDDGKQDLIEFLDEEDLFCKILNECNIDKNKSILTSQDIYSIIKEAMCVLNNKIMFFVLLVCKNYIFPVDHSPLSNGYDKEAYFPKITNLIQQNINYDSLIEDNNALTIIDWMFDYLDSQTYVCSVVDKLLKEQDVTKILDVLLTDEEENGSLIFKLFNKIKLEDELKKILLEIYYNPIYEDYKTKDKYIVKKRYEYIYIVEWVLNLYYGILITRIKTNAKITENGSDAEKIVLLKEELDKYNENEIKYAIYSTAAETQSANMIREFLEGLKINQLDMYEKNYTTKFELFFNV